VLFSTISTESTIATAIVVLRLRRPDKNHFVVVCNFEQTNDLIRGYACSVQAIWSPQPVWCVMLCLSCGSDKLAELTAEMLVHYRGLKHLEKPGVWLFPEVLICLDCGFGRFIVPRTELASVASGASTDEPSNLGQSAGDSASRSPNAF